MNHSPGHRFTCGEFARLHAISKRTLMYYSDIGLFPPAATGRNGYRYYTASQTGLLDAILVLRDLGTPINDIIRLLKHRTPERFETLLNEQGIAIDQKIATLQRLRQTLENRKAVLTDGLCALPGKIAIAEQEAETLALSDPVGQGREDSAMRILYKHANFCYQNNFWCGYPLGGMISTEKFSKTGELHYRYFYMRIQQKSTEVSIHEKPAGNYLTAYFSGDWTPVIFHPQYRKMLTYAQRKGITLAPDAYEDSVIDDAAVTRPEDYLTRITIQIIE